MFQVLQGANFSSKYPLVNTVLGLNAESSIATWGMDSKTDYSNNGHSLITDNAFNNKGMVLVPAAGNNAETGVAEPDDFSFVICLNIPSVPSQNAYIISNFSPAAAPYAGIRLVQSTSGAGLLHVATGSATSPTVTEVVIPNITGGVTYFSATISSSLVSVTRANGDVIETAITGGRAKSSTTFLLNGSPVPAVNYGANGIMLGLALYGSVLTPEESAEKREAMRVLAESR